MLISVPFLSLWVLLLPAFVCSFSSFGYSLNSYEGAPSDRSYAFEKRFIDMGSSNAKPAVPEPAPISPAPEGEVKKLKPCCACPETKRARDACIIENGEANCQDLIEAHKDCMRRHGFNI